MKNYDHNKTNFLEACGLEEEDINFGVKDIDLSDGFKISPKLKRAAMSAIADKMGSVSGIILEELTGVDLTSSKSRLVEYLEKHISDKTALLLMSAILHREE